MFEIENTGRVPITLVRTDADEGFGVRKTVRIRDVPIEGDANVGKPIPVEGVEIAAGERRLLETTFRWEQLCGAGEGPGLIGPSGVTLSTAPTGCSPGSSSSRCRCR